MKREDYLTPETIVLELEVESNVLQSSKIGNDIPDFEPIEF